MATVFNISDFKAKKQKTEIEKQNNINQTQQIINRVVAEWEYYYHSGKIKELFSSKLNIKPENVLDLNIISLKEKELGMEVALFYPKTLPTNQNGFIAGFNHEKYALATPEMISEIDARLLNIFLFLEISNLEKSKI